MKILMVASFLPYPLYSGGHVRLYNLIKELSEKHEITLICEKRNTQTSEDVKEVEKICRSVITVDRKKQWTINNLLRSLSSSNSFLRTGHTHPDMQNRIKEELRRNKFDLIHVETFYIFQNLPQVTIPIVVAEHNIEYLVYKRFADRAPLFLRSILNVDIAKIKKEEEKTWAKADKLIAVSEEDRKIMEEKGFNPVIIANGVDINKFGFKDPESRYADASRERKILFIGDFKWIQNLDAAKFIIKEIWPEISARIKAQNSKFGIKLWIVGRKIPETIKRLTKDPDIIFDEKNSVRPTEQLFQEADGLLSPIRVGGGTSYKILESMSSGTPVITTSLSAQAINARDHEELMIGESAQELAEKAFEVLQDKKLYEKLSLNGRKLIEKEYTWKEIGKRLDNVYKKLA